MRIGLLASFGLHAVGLLAFGLVVRTAVEELPAPVDVVPVEAIIGDITNIAPIAAPTPRQEDLQPLPEGAPADAGLDQIILPETVPTPKPPPPPPPERKKPEERLNLDDLSRLLDRSAKKEGQPTPQSSPNAPVGDKPRQALGAGTGLSAVAEAKIRALLVEKMKSCWRTSVDARDPERLRVKVRFKLDKSGALLGQPQLLTPVSPADRELLVAAERAKSAVRACAPYDDLPSDLYAIWDEVTLNFLPTGVE